MFSSFLDSSPVRFWPLILYIALTSVAWAQTAEPPPLYEIQALVNQKLLPQALEKTDSYIASKPRDAEGYFMKGVILTEMKRPVEAMAVFVKLTENFPEFPEPYNNLAVLYAQQKQYDKALTALEMAIRTRPDYAIAYENLGDLYAKLASQAYDKAIQLDASTRTTQTKRALINELIDQGKASDPSFRDKPLSASP